VSEITFTLPVGAELHLRLDQPEHADETFALIEKDRGGSGPVDGLGRADEDT